MDFKEVFGVDGSLLITDYVVVGVCLGVILMFGLYHSISANISPEHFLLGGRSPRTAPIATSLAMLHFSSLMAIEMPADIYYYGIESFMFTVILVVIIPLSAFVFVPMMYRMQLTSVYQYIGHRFDSTSLRCILSLTFVVHKLLLIAIVQGLSSMAMERYFGVPILTSMIGFGAFTAFSVTLGGFSANAWMHVFSFHLTSLFLLILAFVTASKAGGFLHAFELAAEHDRLKLFNFSLDPFQRHNFYNFVFGYGFLVLLEAASDQAVVQRYSSLPYQGGAMKSIFMSIPLLTFPSLLCLMIGLFLQAAYAGCDPITLGKIDHPLDLIPNFVNKSMSFIPGIRGFFIGCIVANSISVCSTLLTSATACTYQDFVSKIGCCGTKDSNERERGRNETATCCRFISLTYAVLATALTVAAVKFSYHEKIQLFSSQSNIYLFHSVLIGPLAAVFLMAMFLPCINKYGAGLGFILGIVCMAYVTMKAITLFTNTDDFQATPLLPIMGDCPDALELNLTFFRFIPWHPKDALVLGPENINVITDKIVTLSYLIFPLLGALLTLLISFPVSILTGGLCICASRKVPASMLHPTLNFSDCCIDSEERELQHAISHRYVDRIASVHNLFPGSNKRLDSKPPSYKYSSLPNTPTSVT